MKAYTKVELAAAAGVSTQTFRRWLKTDESYLRAHNVTRTTKLLTIGKKPLSLYGYIFKELYREV